MTNVGDEDHVPHSGLYLGASNLWRAWEAKRVSDRFARNLSKDRKPALGKVITTTITTAITITGQESGRPNSFDFLQASLPERWKLKCVTKFGFQLPIRNSLVRHSPFAFLAPLLTRRRRHWFA